MIISHRLPEGLVGHDLLFNGEEIIELLDLRLGDDGPERLARDIRDQAQGFLPQDHIHDLTLLDSFSGSRHRSNVEIASRKAAPKDLSWGGSDHPTERPGEVCRIRETGRIRCIRHRRAARELTGTTLQAQPEYVRS